MRRISTSVDVDINDCVSVDISLGLNEIKDFFDACNDKQKLEIASHLRISTVEVLKGKTLLDTLKLELLNEAGKKYTLDELEKRLK